jgi:hypothetical protein
MKKMITSASLVALGAAGVHAAYAPELSPQQTTKPWSVSASLRGFYDDNYNTAPRGLRRDSFGIEVSPSAALNLQLEQTFIGLSYVYGMRWYEDRSRNSADHTHQANAKVSHAFTDRYRLDLGNSFVYAQEPTLVEPLAGIPLLRRAEQSAVRNYATSSLSVDLTEELSTVVGYSNTLVDYEQSGPGSYSALLDRMEHEPHISLRWRFVPTTIGVLGYQFQAVNHTSNSRLTPALPAAHPLNRPEVRDRFTHFAFLGIDHTFNHALSASVRGGAQFTSYHENSPVGDQVNPYVDANTTWTYLPDSYVTVGLRHTRTQTDVGFFGPILSPTMDAETTAVYGSLNHKFGPVVASLMGQYQNSRFQGGFAHNQREDYFLTGINLAYEINPFLLAETGYNFDRIDSDLPFRTYTRNRVYVGLRATY